MYTNYTIQNYYSSMQPRTQHIDHSTQLTTGAIGWPSTDVDLYLFN
jgi:hypothetical protein